MREVQARSGESLPGRSPLTATGAKPALQLSLLLAAVACVLRPTNLLIWMSLAVPTMWLADGPARQALVRNVPFCGSIVLAASVVCDRLYYQRWAFPPYQFLYFNIAKSLAVFYGQNRNDYYFTEGLPLLLTTALPFALVGVWSGFRSPTGRSEPAVKLLAALIVFVTTILSLVSHKEVRFLYPLLPALHVIAAGPLNTFLSPFSSASSLIPRSVTRRLVLGLALSLNLIIALYTTQVHQRGVIDVLHFLRHRHEYHVARSPAAVTTVGFLMPCHSTPWRSHLIYPRIEAWALTCEPPIEVPLDQRAAYLDEADVFYADPVGWITVNLAKAGELAAPFAGHGSLQTGAKRPRPAYLVLFEQLRPVLGTELENRGYELCWKGFNTHWHDDRRRKGDVLVYCMDEKEQLSHA